MSSFETPEPILLSVELGAGEVRIAAGERRDTVVEVRPSDPSKGADVLAAEQTLVEYAEGALVVRAPRRRGRSVLGAGSESVDVQVDLPAGSHLVVQAGCGAIRSTGRLGKCQVTTGAGEIRLSVVGPARLRSGAGDITVDRVAGLAEVSTGAGSVRITAIDGAATIKGSTGETWIGEVSGVLEVRAPCGSISVDRAEQAATAKTGYGDVRLGEVSRGAITARTGHGQVEVGVREGVAAWLDLQAHHGNLHSDLGTTSRPQPGEEFVEVLGRSSFGDITVRRS